MKKVLSVAFVLAAAKFSYSQVSVSDSLKKHYFNTYEHALKYNDLGLAITSLNNLIVEMPASQAMAYKDTLSMLYFSRKDYLTCLLLAQEVYKANSSNINALARAGDCFQASGDYKNAATAFETVAPALKDPFYYYQLAVCQYSLKKIPDCQANADKVLADTNSNHIEPNPIPTKWALHHMGLIEVGLRLPLVPLSPALHDVVRSALVQSGVIDRLAA